MLYAILIFLFKGPALLAYNNSIFDDSDFQSIRNIEKSEKYDKPLKIGKFGLGFNSIYHLTGKYLKRKKFKFRLLINF